MPDSDTGSLHRVIQFDVYNLGVVRDVNMGGFRGRKSDPNIQLVNKAEEAQVSQNASMIVKELKLQCEPFLFRPSSLCSMNRPID